jgi:integrase
MASLRFASKGAVMVVQLVRTVADVFRWYATHELRRFSPKALKERRRIWALFSAFVGDAPFDRCCAAVLLDFIVSQPRCKSNHTRKRFNATVNTPFNEAVRVGLIARNPFRGLRIPEGPEGRDWTAKEYSTVMRLASKPMRLFLVFLRFSGARPGEARDLEWSHVRDDLGVIVQQNHKTAWLGKGPRRIYFNHVIVRLLAWLRTHSPHKRFVFTNSFGGQWKTRALTKNLQAIRNKSGLSNAVKLHGGRHTYSTHALMNGTDLADLAQLLGHRSISSTLRYTHLTDKSDYLRAASEKAVRGKTG